MKITMLGCGGSGGVPICSGTPGGNWGNCNPNNPKNRRRRVSILVEHEGTTILVDTGPDLRVQLLDSGVECIDAVLYTHDHADHTHGLDELRYLAYKAGGPIETYMDEADRNTIIKRFPYAFTSSCDPESSYTPMMNDQLIEGPFSVGAIDITPFYQDHGSVQSLGFRFGDFAYSTDVVDLDERAFETLAGIKYWIVGCLRYEPHPSHAHFEKTLSWIERLKPERAVLTHLNQQVDYDDLLSKCPEGVEPGYDGLIIEC
ncbi:MBL fold metallo-hydrolase [Kiloniella laminariae]|uniref:MBL fold metallo-hydrolase n=1 Tax=Kiloniella laminariae TaxID=454162 RepID=UPI00036BBC4C|nr:MBL fold metallo-hydrolase [Kiloniella laminariae]